MRIDLKLMILQVLMFIMSSCNEYLAEKENNVSQNYYLTNRSIIV